MSTEIHSDFNTALVRKAEDVKSDVCPVCKDGFAHTANSPTSITEVESKVCCTTFGVVFIH